MAKDSLLGAMGRLTPAGDGDGQGPVRPAPAPGSIQRLLSRPSPTPQPYPTGQGPLAPEPGEGSLARKLSIAPPAAPRRGPGRVRPQEDLISRTYDANQAAWDDQAGAGGRAGEARRHQAGSDESYWIGQGSNAKQDLADNSLVGQLSKLLDVMTGFNVSKGSKKKSPGGE